MNNSVIWAPGVTLDQIERQIIFKALTHYRSKVAAANALGRTVRTLDNKLEQYETEDKERSEVGEARAISREEWLAKSRGTYRAPENPVQQVPTNEETRITNLRKGRAPKSKMVQ